MSDLVTSTGAVLGPVDLLEATTVCVADGTQVNDRGTIHGPGETFTTTNPQAANWLAWRLVTRVDPPADPARRGGKRP